MRLIFIAVCMLLAVNLYAADQDQAPAAEEAKSAASEPQKPVVRDTRARPGEHMPQWADPDAPFPWGRDSTEPSYDDTDSPSFQPSPR